MTDLRLRFLHADDWRVWREIRLRALADSPDAFGSTLARERSFTEVDWRRRCGDRSVVAFHGDLAVACGAVFADRPGYAAVVAMWVDPAQRGRGHSRRILDALVA
ncbi:MAG: GNAT family N-acetyltransferase [Marmoricola sp.]